MKYCGIYSFEGNFTKEKGEVCEAGIVLKKTWNWYLQIWIKTLGFEIGKKIEYEFWIELAKLVFTSPITGGSTDFELIYEYILRMTLES